MSARLVETDSESDGATGPVGGDGPNRATGAVPEAGAPPASGTAAVVGRPAEAAPPPAGSVLSTADVDRLVKPLQRRVEEYYNRLPVALVDDHALQTECLGHLRAAMNTLARTPPTWDDYADAQEAVTRVAVALNQNSSAAAFWAVTVLVVMSLGGVGFAIANDRAAINNAVLYLGVPALVWGWAAAGSLTSMLLRAGQTPFPNWWEAVRWVLYRPLVGVVMGALLYLLVKGGLIVFSASGDGVAPRAELIAVIAFAGSFSDELSVNLLQKVIGRFRTTDAPTPSP